MLTDEVKKYIDKSVLCWLATSNKYNEPNVSPKEIFTYKGDTTFLIANLASPNSIDNIKDNPNVCISFVDVFVQKGFKLKGIATLIDKTDDRFALKVKSLTDLFTDKFPIKTIIEIQVTKVDAIQAPSYFLYNDITEQSQINNAMKSYKVKPVD
ncbi:pyridoxamine 5'-phosphate oxidase family protein [Chryseobacterium sp. YIM B08800]|uniref:pyridoxamine 5'-phosphate oxidase family protein n=1 Tax=Chryseobacterium sp. YIM B08800 TaxID=2984136 RepID=UPI00223F68F1|nr:pyridoxamine 5'-phosphate oxidase family protein [Chryseobacterium sp. YIM B08800]